MVVSGAMVDMAAAKGIRRIAVERAGTKQRVVRDELGADKAIRRRVFIQVYLYAMRAEGGATWNERVWGDGAS